MERKYKYIDPEKIRETEMDDEPANILYESILDVLQLAAEEGMSQDELGIVVSRVVDYRASRHRSRLRLHGPGEHLVESDSDPSR